MDLKGKCVLLGVSGGIAAYKMANVASALRKLGADVEVIMTKNATQFITPITFETLTGHKCMVDTCDRDFKFEVTHISLAKKADVILVAPATANVIAKMAHGIADDAVSTTLLACPCPVVVAPAMNVHMWQNLATVANVETLKNRNYLFVGPESGRLACGETGAGKLASIEQIVSAALYRIRARGDLAGRRIVITAGPTHEPVDPVRYLSNASSGKMGYAIAAAAAAHGAHVTLVSGPVSLPEPAGVGVIHVTTAAQMLEATQDAFATADAAILAAAVSDYRPEQAADHKLKKAAEPIDNIALAENPDILATLSQSRGSRVVIGFAAETDNVLENARKKLATKGCDLIVANDVSRDDSTFGSDTNRVTLVGPHDETELDCMPKEQVAEKIIERLHDLLEPDEPLQQASAADQTLLMPRTGADC